MPLDKGTRLGSYEILGVLGAGGMGEVYRARDTRLDREVAVKVLPQNLAENRRALERFEREAKAVAALAHPNILAIYDFDANVSPPYAVMELLEGQTLREHVAGGTLSPRKAAALARQVADGLGAAHENGIVHRDLKPDNVFITNDGRAKVLDFGLAADRSVSSSDHTEGPTVGTNLTDPGTVLGTVGYMSPEQVRGEPVDHRSDIFSFGCLLYEMLGGKQAFKRDTTAETMTAVLREEPDNLESVSGVISPALDRVVRRCLEKNPRERFQSMRDLAFAIDNATTDSDSGARAAELGTTGIPGRRTIPGFRWPLVAVAAVLGFAAGFVILNGSSREGVETTPPRIRSLTVSGMDLEPSASPDGRFIAFRSNRDGESRIWLKQLDGGGEEPLTDGPDELPKFSPDGSSILFVRDEGRMRSVYRQSMLGGQARKVIEDAADAVWSPDGERIAFIRFGGASEGRTSLIGIASAGGGDEEVLLQSERSTLSSISWSPDGERIAVLANSLTGNNPDGRLLLLNVASREVRRVDPSGVGFPMSGLTWTNEGDLVLAVAGALLGDQGDATSRFVRYDPRSGEVTTLFWGQNLFPIQGLRTGATKADIIAPGMMVYHTSVTKQRLMELGLNGTDLPEGGRLLTRTEGRDRQPTYSPDGRQLMFTSNRAGNLDLWIMDLASGRMRQITDDAAQDWDPGFSPDGQRIVWSSDRNGHLEIWAANADGSGARQLSNDGADAENPTFTPDGEWVVYWSANPDQPGVWKIRADGSDATQLAKGAFVQPEVSPDGRYAAYLFLELEKLRTLIRVCEVSTGDLVPFEVEVATPTGSEKIIIGRLRWMPDGSALAFVGVDENNLTGVYAQDFVPGEDTRHTRRKLAGFSPDFVTESFGISRDGSRLTLSIFQQTSRLMLVDGLTGMDPPR
jgi:serine/threonine protein kinase/Tol biopolymer transport system component